MSCVVVWRSESPQVATLLETSWLSSKEAGARDERRVRLSAAV